MRRRFPSRNHSGAVASVELSRGGYTVVQVLVVVAILGLLAALTLSAVQQARGALRRADCGNRLRQIALANASYEAAFGWFPAHSYLVGSVHPSGHYDEDGRPLHFVTKISGMTNLLPYLDRGDLYDQLRSLEVAWGQPLYGQPVTAFRCPADPRRLQGGGNCNYRMNGGSTANLGHWLRADTAPAPNGPFRIGTSMRPGQVVGGLSHTAGFSERLLGDGDDHVVDPIRDALWVGSPQALSDADGELLRCAAVKPIAEPNRHCSTHGLSWLVIGLNHTAYNHVDTPMADRTDCLEGELSTASYGTATATSGHGDGVNVALLDGGVRWVGASIDRSLWRTSGSVTTD